MEIALGQVRTFLAAALGAYAARHVPPEILSTFPEGWAEVLVTVVLVAPVAAWSAWSKRK